MNAKLNAIYFAEGRATYTQEEENEYLEYYLKDHLGNTRVRIADKNGDNNVTFDINNPEDDEVMSTHHYYPFGERGCARYVVPRDRSETESSPRNRHRRERSDDGVWTPDRQILCSSGMEWDTPKINALANGMVNSDLNQAQSQFDQYGSAVQEIINAGIESGVIPENLQSVGVLGDLANYVFQGEFVNTYDDKTFQQMREVAQFLIESAGIELNCDKCQQNQK